MRTDLLTWLTARIYVRWMLACLPAALWALASCTDSTGPADAGNCLRGAEAPRIDLECSREPLAVVGDPGFTTIVAGHSHTCGLTAAGEVFCWGDNGWGALGNDTTNPVSSQPVRVAGGQRFASITAGAHHSCALTAEGAAYCWGENSGGRLGTEFAEGRSYSPVPVVGGIAFAAISAGGDHTCGVDFQGAAHCWGADYWGELGRGVWDGGWVQPTPSAVVGGLTFTRIAAGGRATCALTAEGRAYCWGFDGHGQLGTRDTGVCRWGDFGSVLCSPVPLPVATVRRFLSLSSGGGHSCALTPEGEALCWGDPGQGKLGPAAGDGFSPTAISAVRFAGIYAGGLSTCGITTIGPTLCWGLNHFGQLGTGSREYASETPRPVLGGHTFSVVAVGGSHTCAITVAGRTYCWGSNERAQLGTGKW